MVENLTGRKFSHLTAVRFNGIKDNKSMWYCICDCGNFKIVSLADLKLTKNISCGCKQEPPEIINSVESE